MLIKAEKEAVYSWHLQFANFFRSFPSWERAEVVSYEELPGRQARVVVAFGKIFGKLSTTFRIHYPIGTQVIRVKKESGPIKSLDLHIEIKSLGENLYELVERVEYVLICPRIFSKTRAKMFEKRIKRFFDYKHDVMLKDFEIAKASPLKILVSGSTGLVGTELTHFLRAFGHEVIRFDRRLKTNVSELEGLDAVVHLSGRSIQARWTKKVQKEIFDSRVETTKQLAETLAGLQKPPKVFLAASAVGYYGDQGGALIDERGRKGEGSFLAGVCEAWEGASAFLKVRGVRVVHLRFGAIFSSKKGALYEMVKLFRRGLCGILGSGDQYVSWIAIDDAIGAIYHTILHKELEGAVNITSPHPVSNRELTKKISTYLKKPLGPSITPALLRLFKGKMADELLLSSIKVYPKKLIESGYEFRYPYLEEAISHLIY